MNPYRTASPPDQPIAHMSLYERWEEFLYRHFGWCLHPARFIYDREREDPEGGWNHRFDCKRCDSYWGYGSD